jgi:pimeloyl-ACP methyl ester carboxylesterase
VVRIKTPGGMAALLVVSAALLATPAAVLVTSADASQPSADLREFYDQKPAWAPCDFDATIDCAPVRVPLDYAHPDGKRISIAISRQRASDPPHRRGVLMANPGGPGGSGLLTFDAANHQVSWPKQTFGSTPLSRSYDLIGFDPRGVNRSAPFSCEEPEVSAPLVSRPTEADFQEHARWAKASEEGCQRLSGEVRPFINTRNTARDMDVIRGVLGEDKINYVGYSYGTYLGAVYGSMFAEHLDRSVLDSSLPPDLNWRKVGMASAMANRANVDAWAEWVAQRAGRYQLGTTKEEVLAAVEATSAKLPTTPDSTGFRPQTRFDQAIGDGSTLRPDWPGLAELVRKTRDTGKFTPPAPPGVPEPGSSTVSGYVPVNQTIHCETDWPSDLDTYRRDVALFSQKYPYGWGVGTVLPDPCTFRSFTPPEKPTHVQRDGYPAGLVVQAEGDVQTAYAGGVAMAERLGDRLITVADDGDHGQYAKRGNKCVDDAVTRYLLDGTLPAAGMTCPGQPRPDIPAE